MLLLQLCADQRNWHDLILIRRKHSTFLYLSCIFISSSSAVYIIFLRSLMIRSLKRKTSVYKAMIDSYSAQQNVMSIVLGRQFSVSPTNSATVEIAKLDDFKQVLMRSMTSPIVVDFYATWCGPCKQLEGPLKAVIKDLKVVQLAKLDIDQQELAPVVQQLGITSVPTLVLFSGGRPVDARQGSIAPKELKAWLQDVLRAIGVIRPTEDQEEVPALEDPETLLKSGFAILNNDRHPNDDGSNLTEAARQFTAVLKDTVNSDTRQKCVAFSGLAMCAAAEDPPNLDSARHLLESAGRAAPAVMPDEMKRAQAVVSIADQASFIADNDIVSLQQKIQKNPSDLEALRSLSLLHYQAGRHSEALDSAMLIVRKDRQWQEEAGKRLVLLFVDALGAENPLSKNGRQRLSNYWFL